MDLLIYWHVATIYMTWQQQKMYERIKNRYGCNDYFDLERNHLESVTTQENELDRNSEWRWDQKLKYMIDGNAYLYLSKQGSWWCGSQLICFNDHNINVEIVQLFATQKLIIFLEHKGIWTARRKTFRRSNQMSRWIKERGLDDTTE